MKKSQEDEKEVCRLDGIRKTKQEEREISFATLRKEYPQKRQEDEGIIRLTLSELQEKLLKRELTAERVMRAFVTQALSVQEEFNCITEFIPGFMDRAKEQDKMEIVKGPLHGFPFCVKDDTAVKGMDSTLGCTLRLNRPSKESAVLVQSLESLGAIPFCITNLPQTCVSFGSGNPIFGFTLNPLNKKLSPGGSSSGSACLVAAGGAPFGTGSDTGGSLRNPAHFCGISTLKQTANRLSRRGCSKCLQNFPGVPGILTKRAKDVATIFKALTENNLQHKLDAKAAPISWNGKIFESKDRVKIGFMTSVASPLAPLGDIPEAILKAKSYLESVGHILVPFKLPFEAADMLEIPWDPDQHGRLDALLRHDQVTPSLAPQYSKGAGDGPHISRNDVYVDYLTKRDDLIDATLDEMRNQGVDLLLCPVFPFPALGVEDAHVFYDGVLYTMTWNALDFPSGVVKVCMESGKNWRSSIENNPGVSHALMEAALRVEEEVKGMPIGVQLVGKPFQEELVLRIMIELDEINAP